MVVWSRLNTNPLLAYSCHRIILKQIVSELILWLKWGKEHVTAPPPLTHSNDVNDYLYLIIVERSKKYTAITTILMYRSRNSRYGDVKTAEAPGLSTGIRRLMTWSIPWGQYVQSLCDASDKRSWLWVTSHQSKLVWKPIFAPRLQP